MKAAIILAIAAALALSVASMPSPKSPPAPLVKVARCFPPLGSCEQRFRAWEGSATVGPMPRG